MNKLKRSLSLVIPVYNEEDHIDVCLAAISDQTVMPLEVIVVDNNSTDASMQIAKQYSFVRIVHASMRGIAHARNVGFDAAQGDIIGRIDADTVLPHDWVEKVLDYTASHPNTLITGGSYMYDLGFPKFFGWIQEKFAFSVNKIIIGNYIAWGSNMAFPAAAWRKVRNVVHNDKHIHEDIDLGLHLTEAGYKIHYESSLKVGIDSRILTPRRKSRQQQMKYLMMWPDTLKKHNMKRAWIGTLGAYFIYYVMAPIPYTYWLINKSRRTGNVRQEN